MFIDLSTTEFLLFVSGADGTHCELDSRNECASKPCQHNATCQDRVGDYACYCPQNWSGKNCDVFDINFRGGIGRATVTKPPIIISSIEMELERQREQCIINQCREKAHNYKCDDECNTFACNFDGNDCSLGINPWRNCTAPNCWSVFMNGICDEECNNAQCLFDGRDCEKQLLPCK